MRSTIAFTLSFVWLLCGCSRQESVEPGAPAAQQAQQQREQCTDHNPQRNPYFGELHVHTSLSMDAYTFDVTTTPDDAYRFARGEEIDLQGGRKARLERPLDFTAVTDHASYLGEGSLCTREGSPVYETDRCALFRGEVKDPEHPLGEMGDRLTAITSAGISVPERSVELCGEDFERCRRAMDSVWRDLRDSAERHYDRTAECRFTTFNGYEYTAQPGFSKIHRNVVFRNDRVPDRPIAWVDEPSEWRLWEKLREQCLEAGDGCDVLTLPHNSNMANGRMWTVDYRDAPRDEQIAKAKLRAELEPLVEIMQTKGDSECRNGLWKVMGGPDEQCDFEKWRPLDRPPEDCRDGVGAGALYGQGCISRLDFTRYALVEGLREAERIGVNPYKLGITASTDTHNSTPGDVNEASFDGLLGKTDATPQQRLGDRVVFNPGGLVGVWAEENSRDALFDAMKRRETFGTSGTRIVPRFFGGWSYPADLCEDAALVEVGYAQGVAMGGDLPPGPGGAAAPTFVVSALRDPTESGRRTTPLQRIQIIKGWPGPDDEIYQRVFDVAGDPQSGTGVDVDSCEPRGAGADALCAVWRDPEFDPGQSAVYYARVLEHPSCRWSTLQCNALPEAQRPASCTDPRIPKLIQERAWTSPIWYEPTASLVD